MKCVSFKSLERGSLLGFADLQMDSGLILLGCTFHESNGKRWCSPPGRPQLDGDKKPMLENGKVIYAPVIDFADKSLRFKWSAQAVAAIDAFLDSKAPTKEQAGAMSGGEAAMAGNQRARDA